MLLISSFGRVSKAQVRTIRRPRSCRFLYYDRTYGCDALRGVLDTPATIFIDNTYSPASDGSVIETFAPHDGKVLDSIANATEEDVNRAVASARSCFDSGSWSDTPVDERAEVLRKISTALREPRFLKTLSKIESLDCGKPLVESAADIEMCADLFDFYADVLPDYFKDERLPAQEEGYQSSIVKEPAGVIAMVTPWNFPLMQAVVKVAPALAAGCSMILKPSPWASLTCSILGGVVRDAGVPKGVLNILTGGPPGGCAGEWLTRHPDVDLLSFTGSGPTGTKLLRASAEHLRPTALELGGKGALIVFEDADLDVAVDWALVGIFVCSGQVCSATSRLLVHESIADEIIARLKTKADAIVVGDPLDGATQMGPVVSREQYQKVTKAIDHARADGCKVVCGGVVDDGGSGGYFVRPTVLADVPRDSETWREEIFGPVLAIRTFSDEAEAVDVANDSEYGLANAVLSRDVERAARVSRKLQSGIVWENCNQVIHTATPFGGKKKSGFGREFGKAGLHEYVHRKTVVSATPGVTWNWYG